MAAVIVPTSTPTPHRAPAPRPDLRVIPGGRDAARRRRRHPAVYRRRRIAAALGAVVVALTIVLAVVGAASLLAGVAGRASGVATDGRAPAGASTPGPEPAATVGAAGPVPAAYVVQPGDTVWAIARRLQAEGDVRPLVDRIADRTDGGALVAGQRIVLEDLVD